MDRRKTVILHVGLRKTATSSIQNTLFLDSNSGILEDKGFIYPKSWSANHSSIIFKMFSDNHENHHGNIKNRYSKEEIRNINEYYNKKVMEELVNKKASNLIISGEGISILDENKLVSLKAYLNSVYDGKVNIRVIVYVRNPISWVVSEIQQVIKVGRLTLQKGLIVYKRSLKNLFRVRIGNLIQVFGKDAVEIYSFEDAIKHKFGPVGHFLSVIGLNDTDISKFKIIKSNKGISQIAVNLISYINQVVPLVKNCEINKGRMYEDLIPLRRIRGSKFDISYKDKKELLEVAREDIRWLKDNVGIDYSDIKIQAPKKFEKQLSEETIRDIKKVFYEVSGFIKFCIVEYFENQLKENKENVDIELIEGILEGTLCKTLYDKEYNVVDIEMFPIIYKLKNKPINISKDVIQIEKKNRWLVYRIKWN